MNLLNQAKSIKTMSIWAFFLIFTIIGIIVTEILCIVAAIKIISTDWKNQSLNNEKTLWGLMCLFLLGPIAGWIFGAKAVNELQNNVNANPTV